MNNLVQIALESMGSVKVERCFHQVFPPGEHYARPREGKGNCYDCTFHPRENRQCQGYRGVMVAYHLKNHPRGKE